MHSKRMHLSLSVVLRCCEKGAAVNEATQGCSTGAWNLGMRIRMAMRHRVRAAQLLPQLLPGAGLQQMQGLSLLRPPR